MVDLILENKQTNHQGSPKYEGKPKKTAASSQSGCCCASLETASALECSLADRKALAKACRANHFKGHVQFSFYTPLKKLPEEDSKIRLCTSRYIPKCLAEAPAKQTFMRMRRWASGMSCNSCIANIGQKLKVAYNQASWSEKKDDTDIRYVTSPNIYEPLGLVGLKPKNKLLIGMRMAVWHTALQLTKYVGIIHILRSNTNSPWKWSPFNQVDPVCLKVPLPQTFAGPETEREVSQQKHLPKTLL